MSDRKATNKGPLQTGNQPGLAAAQGDGSATTPAGDKSKDRKRGNFNSPKKNQGPTGGLAADGADIGGSGGAAEQKRSPWFADTALVRYRLSAE